MKELDVLLERFLADGYGDLDEAGREDFLRLLECEDPVLWEWLIGHSEPYETNLRSLVERIRRYRVSEARGVGTPPRDTP
jgi:antitoxin CptB